MRRQGSSLPIVDWRLSNANRVWRFLFGVRQSEIDNRGGAAGMRVVKGAYLAPHVVVTGDVVLGAGANLWYGTIVRGDLARVTLGEGVNIQDGCILHTDSGAPL